MTGENVATKKVEKRFTLNEVVPNTDKKKKVGTYDTYEEACGIVDRLPKERIPNCSVEDKEFKI
jgi:hypothetical protein